jgi:hypothetical protein
MLLELGRRRVSLKSIRRFPLAGNSSPRHIARLLGRDQRADLLDEEKGVFHLRFQVTTLSAIKRIVASTDAVSLAPLVLLGGGPDYRQTGCARCHRPTSLARHRHRIPRRSRPVTPDCHLRAGTQTPTEKTARPVRPPCPSLPSGGRLPRKSLKIGGQTTIFKTWSVPIRRQSFNSIPG